MSRCTLSTVQVIASAISGAVAPVLGEQRRGVRVAKRCLKKGPKEAPQVTEGDVDTATSSFRSVPCCIFCDRSSGR